jgi:hypothetical protein
MTYDNDRLGVVAILQCMPRVTAAAMIPQLNLRFCGAQGCGLDAKPVRNSPTRQSKIDLAQGFPY